MSYIKIVHKVEAVKFTGCNFDEIAKFMKDTEKVPMRCIEGECLKIPSCKTDLWIGYYLIKDENGTMTISDSKSFEETYREVN